MAYTDASSYLSEANRPHSVKSLPFKPPRLNGLSERLLASHYENNYGGAVRRLNAIEARLCRRDQPQQVKNATVIDQFDTSLLDQVLRLIPLGAGHNRAPLENRLRSPFFGENSFSFYR